MGGDEVQPHLGGVRAGLQRRQQRQRPSDASVTDAGRQPRLRLGSKRDLFGKVSKDSHQVGLDSL